MYHTITKCSMLVSMVLAGGFAGVRTAQAGPEENFYRAYYLQNEVGDLGKAYDLYEKAAKSKKLDA